METMDVLLWVSDVDAMSRPLEVLEDQHGGRRGWVSMVAVRTMGAVVLPGEHVARPLLNLPSDLKAAQGIIWKLATEGLEA